VHPGADVLAGVPPTWLQRIAAAGVAANGVASHASAARAWGLRGFRTTDRLHVSIGEQRRASLDGVTVHRRRGLNGSHYTTTDAGLRVTTVAVTLLDICYDSSVERARSAFHDAWCRELVQPDDVAAVIEELGRSGRIGTVRLRDLLERYGGQAAPARSKPELTLFDACVDAGLPEPVLNHTVRRVDGRTAVLDLAWPDARYCIEVDTVLTHGSPEQWVSDSARSAGLGLMGWYVDRVTDVMIDEALVDVLALIGRRLLELPAAA
jgi:hypothetical protein